ncbi:MAG: Na+:solute symporter [Candidatus Atelocyanobacterium thalassa]|uniref:Na+/proline symporter n=1 Tax=Candidatus Atelocyanobacterium thalassa isolate SIO64986 TaxID=1527444 RepID=A0A086CH57_9CHRO|nr:MAG: Na+/proline symporter [Candidatus Atelocyanobacterium thalassa isolate SIO64986]
MHLIDWIVVLIYFFVTTILGLFVSYKKKIPAKNLEDNTYFVSDLLAGRNLSWWLAGTSMAATTFSIDTPLYICGIVASRGIVGNWEWWSFGISNIFLIYVFAGMWRRSGLLTDAEITELRYGGRNAAILRATKAFLFAIPINCIGIGYAMLAMIKMVNALELWQSLGFNPGEGVKLWTIISLNFFVLIYTGISGLWGVVITDFFQFFLGLVGSIILSIVTVYDAGGIGKLVVDVQNVTDFDVLSFIPIIYDGNFSFTWNDAAGITATTFSTYLFVQWWSFRRSDGGGEFVQRLLSVRGDTETKAKYEAEKATWLFNILNYVVRTWPWIVTALASIVLLPNLEDPELAYPTLMITYLPPIALGLVVSSLIAAFMSTISTSINWGASYLSNDLYKRFFRPEASDHELTVVVKIASVVVIILGSITAFYANDIRTIFRIVLAIGTGPGLVLILRWYWFRINAAAELSAMIAGFILGLISTFNPTFNMIFSDFGSKLLGISIITGVIWITTMFLTPPEKEETLINFYRHIRPGGRGWYFQQQQTGLKPAQDLRMDLLKVLAALLILFGSMFAIGGFLLLQPITGFISLMLAVFGGILLKNLEKKEISF